MLRWIASPLALSLTLAATAQEMKTPRHTSYVVETVATAPAEANDENLRRLKLPAGFHIAKLIDGLDHPRVLLTLPNDMLYVTSRQAGTITLVKYVNGAFTKHTVAAYKDVHGMALHGTNELYFVTIHDVFAAPINPDGTLGTVKKIISGLPDAGQHPDRTLAFGPDGWLYISVGSTCNDCDERNPQNATMLRAHPDGSGLETFATGLRNTIGFTFEPTTGALYGLDDGVDWLGNQQQPEELNLIEKGKKYGWPYIFGNGWKSAYREPPQQTLDDWDKASVRPVLTWTAHASSMQMLFYTGPMFPAEYKGDALATMHGSWNANPPTGYEVVRIRFDHGKPVKIEPFLEGFLFKTGEQWSRFARPFGLAQLKDGSVLMGDEQHGIIYRIYYKQ